MNYIFGKNCTILNIRSGIVNVPQDICDTGFRFIDRGMTLHKHREWQIFRIWFILSQWQNCVQCRLHCCRKNGKWGRQMIVECGCDEAGRGSGAAEVYAGAVILNPEHTIKGLADSKKLTARRREALSDEIQQHALCWFIAKATLEEVETFNVLQASLLAMKRAVEGLGIRPDKVYVDGSHAPNLDIPVEAVVRGDDRIPAISAASILAKVARDAAMTEYHRIYPEYGFDVHKGYLTKRHIRALLKHGPCPIHRKSFCRVMSPGLPF